MEILSFLVSFLIYGLVATPICLVLHELGHAAMILLLTTQPATFQFGERGAMRQFTWGRLTALLYPELRALFFCRYRLGERRQLTRNQDIAITLGGPLSSLLFTLLFAALWRSFPAQGDPWSGLTWISLFNLLISGIPGYYPKLLTGHGSIANDGLQLVQLLRRAPA